MSSTSLSPEELELALARQRTHYLLALNHDLRNPIAAQLNLAESLLDGIPGPLNERQRLYVQRLEEKARLLLLLLGDVMELAGRNAQESIARELPPVRQVCESLVRILNPVGAKKGKRIRLDYLADDSSPPPDTRHLSSILLNICGEVLRHSEPGGEFTLRVQAATEGWSLLATDPGFRPPSASSRKANAEASRPSLDLAVAQSLLLAVAGRVEAAVDGPRPSGFAVFLPHLPRGTVST